MEAMEPYARHLIGIEENDEWAMTAAKKGFEIYPITSWHQKLPEADVYYLWTKDAMGLYLKAKWEGVHGTFIFGKTVRPSLTSFLKEIKAERRDLKKQDWWVYITQL